ncbi:MAG: N-succinylarginine dihydrolase [Legionella sp.]|nr:N-succinylarginine dihydrolase [Legionella sp.]
MYVYELNMDGLVGPTHHYAGLAPGNIASEGHAAKVSNPRDAARQGLKKMRLLHSLGLKQAIMPPHERPNLHLLHQLGFKGTPNEQINKVSRYPDLLSICYSASSMWMANAATVSPSMDTLDNKVHFTAANMVTNLHRTQEATFSKKLLETIFNDPSYFVHHDPVPSSNLTSDEGAANHTRFCKTHGQPGLHLFVYGKNGIGSKGSVGPKKYPVRQTLEACEAIARKHQLDLNQVLFVLQNPKAIDKGVFHNDVISVGNESLFLVHEDAFFDQKNMLNYLKAQANFPLEVIEIARKEISIEDAVASYLFNSQLITLPHQNNMILIAPIECQYNPLVNNYINNLLNDSNNPINQVYYLDLKQSMHNGGGPACLRLRIPLNTDEIAGMNQSLLVDDKLLDKLDAWVIKHYRDELIPGDLKDPGFMFESFKALDELTQILKLGSIYSFQFT